MHKLAWRSHKPTFILFFFQNKKVNYEMKVKNDSHGINDNDDD
jgi:hypothetical protein